MSRPRRFLVDEPMGTVELPVLILSGMIEPDTRRILADNHIRLDRSPGVYQVIRNARLFGIRGDFDYQDIRSIWTAGMVDDATWEPIGPVVSEGGYTYALLLPVQAVRGVFLDQWYPVAG